MGLLLGIDTGGTYTDAVLVDDARQGLDGVVASAKALTTPIDLALGIGRAVDAVLAEAAAAGHDRADVGLVALSTTLATNALVERRGGRIALVFIGFDDEALGRSGLAEALDGDPVLVVAGGHDSHGVPRAPLDVDALRAGLDGLSGDIVGFAIAAQFGVRNPEHELAARDVVRSITGKPVTCSHELSAKLDGPRRALTSVLNARLIGLIDRLLHATETLLGQRSIDAPLMVVRGDGSLLAVDVARERPIETVLSGPAASIVGARALCDLQSAIVADIGGTTTDIAVLVDGQPLLTPDGAIVGGMRTMVEAVDMHTIGLGGDSEVAVDEQAGGGALRLGPRRVVPVCVIAVEHRDLVHNTFERQLADQRARELSGQFGIAQVADVGGLTLDRRESELLSKLIERPQPLDALIGDRRELLAFERLVRWGYAQRGGFTPTDACHVLGYHDGFDSDAAGLAATLFARRRDRFDQLVAVDGPEVAAAVVATVVRTSADAVLEVALDRDGLAGAEAHRGLTQAALDRRTGLVQVRLSLGAPIVALGAAASTYYPAVGERLDADTVCPPLGAVANAYGAVIGNVRSVVDASVSQLEEGPWRLYGVDAPLDFVSADDALLDGEELARRAAIERAQRAGAGDVEVNVVVGRRTAMVEDVEVLVEASIRATAVGRPRLGEARPD